MEEKQQSQFVETSDIAFDLVGIDEYETAVALALQKLGMRLNAEACRLVEINDKATRVHVVTSWSSGQADMLLPETTYNELTPVFEQLRQANIVFKGVEDDENLPPHADKWFEKLNIKTTILIPVPVHRVLWGYIQIDNFSVVPDDSSVLGLMKLASSIGQIWKQKMEKDSKRFTDQVPISDLLVESIDIGVLLISPKKDVWYVNKKTEDIFEKDSDYFVGKPLQELVDLFPGGSLQTILRNLGYMKMGIQNNSEEFQLTTSSNETRDIQISATSLYEQKQHRGDLILVQDVTYRKRMERSAQDSEVKLMRVLESIKEGITLSDTEGYFEIFNQEMQVLTGYTKEEVNRSKDLISLIHRQEDQDYARAQLDNFNESEKRTSEIIIQPKTGEQKHVNVSTTVIHSDDKRYFLSAYHDETAQKLAEAALEEARDHLEEKVQEKTQQLQETVLEVENLAKFPSEDPFPVMRIQPDGTLLYANSASQALLDLWQTKIGASVPEGWLQLVSEVFNNNSRKIYEIEVLGQFISFVLVPVKSSNYVNLYGRDISKEKEIDQMKNQFISMVSHQIRTPLTSVRWYSEMLLKGKNENALNSKQEKITKTIYETTVSLTELVTDLLSISRMEAGKLEYNPQSGSLVTLAEEIIQEIDALASKSKVTVRLETGSVPKFKFDPKLVREVFLNLLSNAIKYTPEEGLVTVTIKVEDDFVVTTVADTGIGIPEDAKKDIFERFYRAQNAVDREYDGTGLGLSVAKMIVEKAGGKIWFDSELEKGTTFSFSLPIKNML